MSWNPINSELNSLFTYAQLQTQPAPTDSSEGNWTATQPPDPPVGDDSDNQILIEMDEPGDVTSGAKAVTVCIEHWKNAGPDDQKHMWQMFCETGVFLAACRHGFILLICDMIQSGEL